jgi:hypothetical protein
MSYNSRSKANYQIRQLFKGLVAHFPVNVRPCLLQFLNQDRTDPLVVEYIESAHTGRFRDCIRTRKDEINRLLEN